MSYRDLGFEDAPAWGVPSPQSADIVKDALKKETLLKYVFLALTSISTGANSPSETFHRLRKI
jgi:hypothetical protein